MFKSVKRIIDWCGEYKPQLYIGIIITFFIRIMIFAPIMIAGYCLAQMIDAHFNGLVFDESLIIKSFIAILITILINFILTYIKARLQEPIGFNMVAKNRLAVGEALKRVSLGYFSTNNTGSILNAITSGLKSLENLGIRTIDDFVTGYINFILIFIFLLYTNLKLALISLVAVLLSLYFLNMISKCSNKNAKLERDSNRELTKATLEYVRGLASVKSFGQQGVAYDNITNAINNSKSIHIGVERDFLPANTLHLLALKIGSIVLALFTILEGLNGNLDLTMTLIMLMFSFVIFASIEPINNAAHLLNIFDDSLDQLEAITSTKQLDKDGKDIDLDNYNIEFKHVSFSYNSEKEILHDVNFKIDEKTTVAIVGPSGSGKSTICSLIARFYDVSSGEIIIGGHNIKELTCDSLLKNIAMVFQNVYLFNDTIRNNICFGKPGCSEAEMIDAAKKACCHDFIMALPKGYDTLVGETGGLLSGGEKQRISIARAILKNAPIIILDEATASVDPENEHYIQKAISELTRNKTIIIIAHRLATIENADQILVVDEGCIVQKGKHKELLQVTGKYLDFIKAREKAEGWKII